MRARYMPSLMRLFYPRCALSSGVKQVKPLDLESLPSWEEDPARLLRHGQQEL